jgi:diacylglycerol kinase family enzyme
MPLLNRALPSANLATTLFTAVTGVVAGVYAPSEVGAAFLRAASDVRDVFSRRARDAQVLLDGAYDSQEDHGETLLVVNRFAGKGQAEGLAREMTLALAGAAESYFTTSISAQRIMDIKEVLLGRRETSNGAGVNVVATGGDGTTDETMVAVAKAEKALEQNGASRTWLDGFRVTPHPAGVANDFALMVGAFDDPRNIRSFLSLAEKTPLFGMHVRYGCGTRSARTFHSATWGASGEMFYAIKKLRETRAREGGERITVNDYLRMMPEVIAAAQPFYVRVDGGREIKVADVVVVSDLNGLGSVIHAPLPPMHKGGLRLFLIPPVPVCLPAIAEAFLRGALLASGFQAVALTERLFTLSKARQIDVPMGGSVELEFFGTNGRHKRVRGTVSGEYFGETERVELAPAKEPVTILAGPRSDLLARKRRIDAHWPFGKWFNAHLAPFLNNPRSIAAPTLFALAMAADLAALAVEGELSKWTTQVSMRHEPQELASPKIGVGPMLELAKFIMHGTLYVSGHAALGVIKDGARFLTRRVVKHERVDRTDSA